MAPREAEDAHRPVLHDADELALILSEHHVRKLSKNLTFRFERREHQLTGEGKGHRLRGAAVTVCKGFDGSVAVLREGRQAGAEVRGKGTFLLCTKGDISTFALTKSWWFLTNRAANPILAALQGRRKLERGNLRGLTNSSKSLANGWWCV